MTNFTISDLPPVTALTGDEALEAAQAGASMRAVTGQIGQLAPASDFLLTAIYARTSTTINQGSLEVYYDASAGEIDQALPPIATLAAYDRQMMLFWKVDSSAHSVKVSSSDGFLGAPSPQTIAVQGESLTLEVNTALGKYLIPCACAPLPGAPTLTFLHSCDSEIALSWSLVGGISLYYIYQGTSPGGENPTPVLSASSSPATITGLANGTTYYFTIKAFDGARYSAPSNEVSGAPVHNVAPSSPAATAVSSSEIDLSWGASATASTYNIYRGTSPGGENPTPIASGLVGLSYSDTGLSASTEYYYKVGSANGCGQVSESGEVNATTLTNNSYFNAVMALGNVYAYYRLGDAGSLAADSSGNGLDGTYAGTVTKQVPSLINNNGGNLAAQFGGGLVSLPIVPTVWRGGKGSTSPWSWVTWLELAALPLPTDIYVLYADGFSSLAAEPPSDANGMDLRIDENGHFVIEETAAGPLYTSTAVLSLGVRHLLAVRYDGGAMNVYIDNVFDGVVGTNATRNNGYPAISQLRIDSTIFASAVLFGVCDEMTMFTSDIGSAGINSLWSEGH